MNTARLVVVACSLATASAVAQTGRSMKLMEPVVLGRTASMAIEHSPTLGGRPFAMAMCSPSYPGALSVTIPGVSDGVLKLDPLAYGVIGVGQLNASGRSPAVTFHVPNLPLLVGATFDVQGADVDGAGLITLTDNELEIEVAAPPPAALNMVAIAPGTFAMGSVASGNQSLPVHQVSITRPFWMGRYEVTQAEYLALMGTNPSASLAPNQPVEQVQFHQALAYCVALTAQEAAAGRLPSLYEYRLPTEAEWEYCCRAGTTSEYSVGASLSCGQAQFFVAGVGYCAGAHPVAVGSYAANPWGLHEMHGNVWEWCADCNSPVPNYPATAVEDPYVSVAVDFYRRIRGGSFSSAGLECRSGFRSGASVGIPYSNVGFRVVCAPVLL